MYENFIASPISALDEQAPRGASQNPLMRSHLLQLMQTHIRNCDEKRRQEGVDIDLNLFLCELGLDELISKPSPMGLKEKWKGNSGTLGMIFSLNDARRQRSRPPREALNQVSGIADMTYKSRHAAFEH